MLLYRLVKVIMQGKSDTFRLFHQGIFGRRQTFDKSRIAPAHIVIFFAGCYSPSSILYPSPFWFEPVGVIESTSLGEA
jgi:hypothetical protein